MITKLRAYQWGFKTMRKNSYKANRTPYEIIKEEDEMKYATLSKSILDQKFNAFIQGGYHVGLPTMWTKIFNLEQSLFPALKEELRLEELCHEEQKLISI